jgi:uncharacterized membrane protein
VLGLVALTLISIYLLPKALPWSFLRILVGGIFVLFVPGYTLIRLLGMKDVDSAEMIGLSVGLSLVTTTLVGLLLNYIAWGLTVESVTIPLAASSIGMIFLSAYRGFLKKNAGDIRTL